MSPSRGEPGHQSNVAHAVEGETVPPAVAERLRELEVMLAKLDDLDLEGVEPAVRYDPAWPDASERQEA
jgi:hypothetical protein